MRPPSVPQPDFRRDGTRKTNKNGEYGWSLRVWDAKANRQREKTVYGTQRYAAAQLAELRAQVEDAATPALPRAQYVTVGQWGLEFINRYKWLVAPVKGAGGVPRPETTWRNVKANVNAYVVPSLGEDRRVVSVTPAELTAAISSLKVTDHSLPGKPKSKPADPDTQDKAASVTRLMFADAVNAGLILGRSPAADLRTVWGARGRVARVVIPSLVQVEVLAAELEEQWPARGDIARAIAYTALRWENLSCLRWEDVDLERRSILVWRSRPSSTGRVVERLKGGGDDAYITIIDEAVGPLERLRAFADERGADTVVCGERGGMLSYSLWRKHLNRAREASGVPYTGHGLRHVAISLLIAGGAPIELVRQQAMHSSTRTTERVYRHALQVDRRELAKMLRMPTTGIEVEESAEEPKE